MTDEYEILTYDRDVFNDEIKEILEIVRKFIIRKKLIIYGGQAIHYMLKLKGLKLYQDHTRPDLDFYSSEHVKDAVELTNEIIAKGFTDSHAIVAMHPQTMRVRYKFMSVADISYIPQVAIDKFRGYALNYKDSLVTSPFLQYIDMHSSLSFPYKGAPFENIFNRWKKDIERYNMLYEQYPIPPGESPTLVVKQLKVPINGLMHGVAAYGLILARYLQECQRYGQQPREGLTSCEISTIGTDILEFQCPEDMDPLVIIQDYREPGILDNSQPIDFYQPYLDIKPPSIRNAGTEYYIGYNEFYSYNREIVTTTADGGEKAIKINSKNLNPGANTYNIANIQAVMKYFLYIALIDDKPAGFHYYNSLRSIILHMQDCIGQQDTTGEWEHSLFYMSIRRFGTVNKDDRHFVNEYNGMALLPKNYYPDKMPDYPSFEYTKVFKKDGTKDDPSNIYLLEWTNHVAAKIKSVRLI